MLTLRWGRCEPGGPRGRGRDADGTALRDRTADCRGGGPRGLLLVLHPRSGASVAHPLLYRVAAEPRSPRRRDSEPDEAADRRADRGDPHAEHHRPHGGGRRGGGAIVGRIYGDFWIGVFTAALTFAVLVVSEIIPKTLGATFCRQLASPTAYLLRLMVAAMKPVLVPLGVLSRWIRSEKTSRAAISRAEIGGARGAGGGGRARSTTRSSG